MDKKLLSVLVCPSCRSPLRWRSEQHELHCKAEGIAFQLRQGVPVMCVDATRKLSVEEKLGN
jgi:uncharacterized protein YbaR (Trm112 family)